MINRFVIAILLITTLIVATPSAVFADPPDDINTPPSAEYAPETDSYSSGWMLGPVIGFLRKAMSIIYPPPAVLVCTQHSHNPHRSYHYDDRVNGEVRAICQQRMRVAVMSHTATLMKSRFRDVGYSELPNLTEGSNLFLGYNVWRGSANANNDCDTKWFVVAGDGYIIYNLGGTVAEAETASNPVYAPCAN